jgi:hypothetical protein
MKPETVMEYDLVMQDAADEPFVPRACGRRRIDGKWESWLEFDAVGEDVVLRTPQETVQPDHTALLRWARELTVSDLNDALVRAAPVEPREDDDELAGASERSRRFAARIRAEAAADAAEAAAAEAEHAASSARSPG